MEYPVSKIEELCNGKIKLFGMASGAGPLIDEFFVKLKRSCSEAKVSSVEVAAQEALNLYQRMLSEHIEHQVLRPWGLRIGDLASGKRVEEQLLQGILVAGSQVLEGFRSNLFPIIGGIDSEGTKIFEVSNGAIDYLTKLGFAVTGSGKESAEWTLIHNNFDPNSHLYRSLVLGLLAKFQAEESMGVGTNTDVRVVTTRTDGNETLSDKAIKTVRGLIQKEQKRQQNRLENIISRIKYKQLLQGSENEA